MTDKARLELKIEIIIRNRFKSRCSLDALDPGIAIEGLLREYLATPIKSLILPDRDENETLVLFMPSIDRIVRNEFKSRCALEEHTLSEAANEILRLYLAIFD